MANEDIRSAQVRDKTPEQLVGLLRTQSGGPTGQAEELRGALDVAIAREVQKSLDGLTGALNAASASGEALSRRVFWLNVFVALATAVGAAATVVMAVEKP